MFKLDMDYRPASYWAKDDPIQVLLSGIKGEARRQLVLKKLERGPTGDLPEDLFASHLDDAARRAWGKLHPLMMGGEYLPGDLPGETTIARVALNSTTGDVIKVRARPIAEGIRYRVVDEYETDYDLPFETSTLPLTTCEMIQLLDETIGMWGPQHPGLVLQYATRTFARRPAADRAGRRGGRRHRTGAQFRHTGRASRVAYVPRCFGRRGMSIALAGRVHDRGTEG